MAAPVAAEGTAGGKPDAPAAVDRGAVVGATYRHRKGGVYTVEAVALESTNGRPRERVVVYRGTQGLNVRSEAEFMDGRFTLAADATRAAGLLGPQPRLTPAEREAMRRVAARARWSNDPRHPADLAVLAPLLEEKP